MLNELIDVPYHHLVMSAPWQLRPVIAFNREVGRNCLARAATGCLSQWARDQHGMRMGMVAVEEGAEGQRGRGAKGLTGCDPLPLDPSAP